MTPGPQGRPSQSGRHEPSPSEVNRLASSQWAVCGRPSWGARPSSRCCARLPNGPRAVRRCGCSSSHRPVLARPGWSRSSRRRSTSGPAGPWSGSGSRRRPRRRSPRSPGSSRRPSTKARSCRGHGGRRRHRRPHQRPHRATAGLPCRRRSLARSGRDGGVACPRPARGAGLLDPGGHGPGEPLPELDPGTRGARRGATAGLDPRGPSLGWQRRVRVPRSGGRGATEVGEAVVATGRPRCRDRRRRPAGWERSTCRRRRTGRAIARG
jgi:hypothetical protein